MNCSKCQSEKIDSVAGTCRCQDCGHYFILLENPPPGYEAASRDAIRCAARRFEGGAILLAYLGVLILLLAIMLILFRASEGFSTFMAAGTLFILAAGLYLIAQVIHIRANTEK